MGLKTTNFYVKEMQETLPQAYAVIRSLKVDDNGQGVSVIGIHRTRELALNPQVKPFHEEKIYFTADRNVNDRITVYNKAVAPYKTIELDEETGKYAEVEKYPLLYGWEKDTQG